MRLLDVNVLLALFLEAHEHHRYVHGWLEAHKTTPIATCPLTETSLMRLLMNPSIVEQPTEVGTVLQLIESLHAHSQHRFISESPRILASTFAENFLQIQGYRQVTDAYLISLAVSNGGKLLTFDRKLSIAFPDGVEVLIVE